MPEGSDFIDNLNPDSVQVMADARIEALYPLPGERFQFLRHGYFVVDPDTENDRFVFNRIVSLKGGFKK